MKYFLFIFLIFFSTCNVIYSQDFSGVVTDQQTGKPLKNVIVRNKEANTSVITNKYGQFYIDTVNMPLWLEFRLKGYETVTRKFAGKADKIKVSLIKGSQQLSEVVIRSSNVPVEIRELPASVSFISKNDLKRTDNFNLVQNFNYVPGVFVGQGALNTNKINIRGIGSRAQYSTNRIKAYINGIPLTTAEGELTLDDFDADYLERIEIIKGPVSSMYGSGLGGSINLYTNRDNIQSRSFSAIYEYGSFNTQKSGANFKYAEDSLDVSLNYNRVQSDGYRDNGGYDRISTLGTAGLLNKKGNYWTFLFSYSNLKAFIPSSLNKADFTNEPEKAAFTWNQAAGYESYDKYIFGISYEHTFSKTLKNVTSIFYNSRDGYEPRPFNILDEERHSAGWRTRFNYRVLLFNRASEFSFGAETMFEFYETGTFENLYEQSEVRRSIQGERLSLNKQNRNYLNAFAQVNSELSDKFNLEAGINLNTTFYELRDKFNAEETNQSGNYRFDPVLSPRLGVSYEAFDGKNFYASASHGFSIPTVAETLTPDGLMNTDLKAETGWNYELGFKGNWLKNKLYTELNLYSIQIRNLLVARRVSEDQFVGVNAGKADHNGIEFTSVFNADFSSEIQLKLYLNSTFNAFKFDKFVDLGENYSGNTLPGVPEYMVSPGAELNYRGITANINYQAFGRMALNDLNSGYTDPYQLLNFKLDYHMTLSKKLELRFNLGVDNILDEKYASSIVTNAVGFGNSAPRYYYPGTPRNYFGGVRLNFNL